MLSKRNFAYALLLMSGLLFGFSTYVSYFDFDVSYLFLPSVIASLSILSLVLFVTSDGLNILKISTFRVLVYLNFSFLCLFSVVSETYEYLNLRDSILFIYVLIICLLILFLSSRYEGAILFFIVGIYFSLFSTLILGVLSSGGNIPIRGFFSNPNSFGLLSSYTVLSGLVLSKCNANKFFKIVINVISIFIFFLGLLSLSRTAILASIIIISVYAVYTLKINLLKWSAFIMSIALILYFNHAAFYEALDGIMNKSINNSSVVSGRDAIARYYIESVRYFGGAFFDDLYPLDNTFLKLGIKYGYIPVVFFIVFSLFSFFKKYRDVSFLLSFMAFFSIALMETIYYSVPYFMFILFSLELEIKNENT